MTFYLSDSSCSAKTPANKSNGRPRTFFTLGLLVLALFCLLGSFSCAAAAAGALQLKKGNNFISLPVNIADRHPETLFAAIFDSLIAVRYFDGEAQAWLSYVPGRSGANTLMEIPPGAAVLVETGTDVLLPLPGELLEAVDYQFGPGWNMFGVPLEATVETVAEQSDAFIVTEDPVYSAEEEPLRQLQYSEQLQPGRGYWVNTDLDQDGTSSIVARNQRRASDSLAATGSGGHAFGNSAGKSLDQLLLEAAPELNKNDYPNRGADICLGYEPFTRTGQWSSDCFKISEVYFKTDDTNQPSSAIGLLTELPQPLQGLLTLPAQVVVEISYKFDPQRNKALPLYAYARKVEQVRLGGGEHHRELAALDELMIFSDGTLEAELVAPLPGQPDGPEVFQNLSWLHPGNPAYVGRLAMDGIDQPQSNLLLTVFLGDASSANQVWSKLDNRLVFNNASGKDWLVKLPSAAKNIFSLDVSAGVRAAAIEDPSLWLPADLTRNQQQNETQLLEFTAPVAAAWAMQGIFSPSIGITEAISARDIPGLPVCQGERCAVSVNQDGAFRLQNSAVGFADGMLTFSGGPLQARVKGFDLLPDPQIGAADQVSSVAMQWNPRVELALQADEGNFKGSRLMVGVEATGIVNLTSGELGKHFKACLSKPDLQGDDASRIIEIFANKQAGDGAEATPGCKGLFKELTRKDAHGGGLAADVEGVVKGDFENVDVNLGISIAMEKVAVPSSNPNERLRDSNIRGDLDLLVDLAEKVEFRFQNVQELSRTQVLDSQSGTVIFEDTELIETVRGSGAVTFPQNWSLIGGVQIGAELFAELDYEKIADTQEYRCTTAPLLRGYANLNDLSLGQSGWRLSASDLLTIEYEDFSYNTKYSLLPNVGFIKQMKGRFSKGINRITTSVSVIPPSDLALSTGGVAVGQLDGMLILERDVWDEGAEVKSSKWRWTVLVDCDLQLGDKVTVRQFVLSSDPDTGEISVSLAGDMQTAEGSTASIRGSMVIKRDDAGKYAGYALTLMGQGIRFGDSGVALDDAMISYESTKGQKGETGSKEFSASGRTLLDLHAMFPKTFPAEARFNGMATYSSDGMLQVGVTDLGMGGQGIIRSALRLDKDLPVEVMGIRNLIFTRMGSEKSIDVEVDILFEKLIDETRYGDNRAEWPVFTLGARFSSSGWEIRGENLLVEFGKDRDATRVNLASIHLGKSVDGSWQAGGDLEFDLAPNATGALKNIGIKSLPTHYSAAYEYSAAGFLFSAAIDPAPEIDLIGKDVKFGITKITCSKASPWAIAMDSHAEVQGEKLNGQIAFGQGALKFKAPASAVIDLPVIPEHVDLKISNFEIGFGAELGVAGKVKVRTRETSSLRGMLGDEFEADIIASKTSLAFKTDTNINTSLDLGALGSAGVNIRTVALETDGKLSAAGKITINDRSVDLVFGQTAAGTYFTADFGASGVDVDLLPVFQMALKNKLGIESMMAFQVLRIDDAYIHAGLPKVAEITASTKNFKYLLPPGITPVGMPFFDDLNARIMLVGFEVHAGLQFPMPQKSELETTLKAFVEVINPKSTKPWDETEAALKKLNAPRLSVYDVYLQFPLASGYVWNDQRNSMVHTDNLFRAMFGTDRLTFVDRFDVTPVDLVGIAKAANVSGIIQKVMPADLRRGNYNVDLMGFKAGLNYELRDAVVPVSQVDIPQLPKLYDFSQQIGHVYQQLQAEETGGAAGLVNVYPLTATVYSNRPELYGEKEFAYRVKFRKNMETREVEQKYLTVAAEAEKLKIEQRSSELAAELNALQKKMGENTADLQPKISELTEKLRNEQSKKSFWDKFNQRKSREELSLEKQLTALKKQAGERNKSLQDQRTVVSSQLAELKKQEAGLRQTRVVREEVYRNRWLLQKGDNGKPEYQVYLDGNGRIRADVYTDKPKIAQQPSLARGSATVVDPFGRPSSKPSIGSMLSGALRKAIPPKELPYTCIGNTVVSSDQEHELGFGVNLNSGKIRIYLDNRLDKECALEGNKLAEQNGGLYFARRAYEETATSLGGAVSQVKFYDRDVFTHSELKEYQREFKFDNFKFIADVHKDGRILRPFDFPLRGQFTHKGRFRSAATDLAAARTLLKFVDQEKGLDYGLRYQPDGSLAVSGTLQKGNKLPLECRTPGGIIGRDKSHSYAVAYNGAENYLKILVDGFERARCNAPAVDAFLPTVAQIGSEVLYNEIYDKDLYFIAPNRIATRTIAMPADLGGGAATVKTESLNVAADLNALDNLLQFLQSKATETKQFERYFHSLTSKAGKPRPSGNRLRFYYPGLKALDLIVKGTYSAYDVSELKYDKNDRLLLARYGNAYLYQTYNYAGAEPPVSDSDREYTTSFNARSVKIEGRGRIELIDRAGKRRTFDKSSPRVRLGVQEVKTFFKFGYEAVSDWQLEAVTESGIKLVYDAGGIGIYSPDGVKVFYQLPGSRLHKVVQQLNEQVQKYNYQKLKDDPNRFMRDFWSQYFTPNRSKLQYKDASLSYLDKKDIGYSFAPLKYKFGSGERLQISGIKSGAAAGHLKMRFGLLTAYPNANYEGEAIPIVDDLASLDGLPFPDGIGSLRAEGGARARIYSQPAYKGWKKVGSWALSDSAIKTPDKWKNHYSDGKRCLKNKYKDHHMSWGPYKKIAKGNYLATVKYKRTKDSPGALDSKSNKYFEFDVYAGKQIESFWRSFNGISTDYRVRALPFRADKELEVELRSKNSGNFGGWLGENNTALCIDDYSLYQETGTDGYLVTGNVQNAESYIRNAEKLADMENRSFKARSIRLFNDLPLDNISDWTITLALADGVDLLYQNLDDKQNISVNMAETRNRLSLNQQYGRTFVVAADKDGNVYPDKDYKLLVNDKEFRIATLADAASFIRLERKQVRLPSGQQAALNINGGITAEVDKVKVKPQVEYAKTSTFAVAAENGIPYRFQVSPDGRGYDTAEKVGADKRRQIIWVSGQPVAVAVDGGQGVEGGFFANAYVQAGVSEAIQLNLNLTGRIKETGGFYFDGKGNLIIANYELADAEIILSSETGLDIRGKLDVGVGMAEVTGYIRPNGDFSLKGAIQIGIGSGKFTGIKGNAVITNNPQLMLGVYGAAYAAGHKLVSGSLEIKDGRVYFGTSISVGIAGVDGKLWLIMKNGPGFGYDLRAYLKFSVPVVIWAPQRYDCKNTWLGRICLPEDWGWKQISTINVNADAHAGPSEIKVNKIPIDFIAGRLVFDVPTRKMNVEWK